MNMDLDGKPDPESIEILTRALSHLALRIEFLRGRGPDKNEMVKARLKASLKAYSALDSLTTLDIDDGEPGGLV